MTQVSGASAFVRTFEAFQRVGFTEGARDLKLVVRTLENRRALSSVSYALAAAHNSIDTAVRDGLTGGVMAETFGEARRMADLVQATLNGVRSAGSHESQLLGTVRTGFSHDLARDFILNGR